MTKNIKLEICAYNVQSAVNAEIGGADRVELCTNYPEGGTTPSYAEIEFTTQKLNIPVNVLIRPRGGDFCYSNLEYELIKRDVEISKNLGATGVVVGFLDETGKIDIERTKEVVCLADPLEVTFHRAFDMSANLFESLESLMETGVKRILTSGGTDNVMHGLSVLKRLIGKADDKIIIMPGSGFGIDNIHAFLEEINAREIHLSAKKIIQTKSRYKKNGVKLQGHNLYSDYDHIESDILTIKKIVSLLTRF